MALQRFLYADSNGYARQAPASDSLELGGLTMGGDIAMGSNGITGLADADSAGDAIAYGQSGASLAGLDLSADLDMNSNNIANVADATLSHHAVNLSQLQSAVITGGTIKELLLHEDQLDDSAGVLAAVALTMANNPSSGDTITLTDGTTTRTYGAGSGGDVQFTIGATVADTMANLVSAIEGDGSAIWGAAFTTDLDAIDTDGVVVIIEDANTGTAPEIYGTWSTQADCQIVDFTGETEYTKKTTSDLPSSDPAATNFGMRRVVGSLTPGELHYVENNDVIYGWDEDADTWNTFSGSTSIPDATAASGGGIKGKITVDSDYGLSVTTGILRIDVASDRGIGFDGSNDLEIKENTNAGLEVTASGIGIDLAATNPALSFDGSGDLQVDVDTTAGLEKTASGVAIDIAATNPGVGFDGSGDLEAKVVTAGGIEKAATGLQIKIDDTPDTLDVDADGLKVVGLPSLFKINGTAVGANVTAANLDELTGGGATTLHSHAGSDESSRVANDFTAAVNLAAGDPVYFDSTANQVDKADASNDSKYEVVGVASAVINAAASGEICSLGPVDVLSGATPGTRYYLASGGGLTTTSPTGSNWVVTVGFAVDADTLFVQPRVLAKRIA